MVYTGGFFEGVDFVTAFADCSASVGLVMGSAIALMFTFVFYRVRGVMTFQDFAACIPEGFKAMVSPMLILTLAWTLSGMTGLLGAKYYVASLLSGSAAALQYLLPIIIFVVAVLPGLRHRHVLGHLLDPRPHRLPRLPGGRDAGRLHRRLPVRRGLRRPLLAHLRHHHHGLCRRALQPREPCLHPAALRHDRRRHLGGLLSALRRSTGCPRAMPPTP